MLFPYLLNPSHQDSGPSTLPPGLSLLSGYLFSYLNWVELNFVGFVQLDDSLFVEIEMGQSVVVDDPDGAFIVTAFDANHCPGNLLFFSSSFIVFDWLCIVFCCLIGLLMWVLWKL